MPELVPNDELPQANALDQFVRPTALRLLGPALGGLLVGFLGAGTAFALDAASFGACAAAVAAMKPQLAAAPRSASTSAAVWDGLRFRSTPCLALGHARVRGHRLPPLPRPDRGAPPIPRQEQLARLAGGSRHRARCRAESERSPPRPGWDRGPSRNARSRRSMRAGRSRRSRWRVTPSAARCRNSCSRACSSTRSRPRARSSGRP